MTVSIECTCNQHYMKFTFYSITSVNKDAVTTLRRRDQDFTGKHEQINLCDEPDEQIVIVEITAFIVVIFNTLQFGLSFEV